MREFITSNDAKKLVELAIVVFISAAIAFIVFVVFESPASGAEISDRFLDGLAWVESNNKQFDEDGLIVKGDGGRSLGILQEQDIYRREANRVAEFYLFSANDITYGAHCVEAQRECARIVLKYWSEYYEKKLQLGRSMNDRELLSLHRRPNTKWTMKRMFTQHEINRWEKFLNSREKSF